MMDVIRELKSEIITKNERIANLESIIKDAPIRHDHRNIHVRCYACDWESRRRRVLEQMKPSDQSTD